MTNAERILAGLDEKLTAMVELTLYGRAALHLGFDQAMDEHALSRDIDAVLWTGQAEEMNETTNFWPAIDALNKELADQELYISHFFTEDQVILLPDWRKNRVRITGPWKHLELYRLGDIDLLLSKLMRDDPIDRTDALFIVTRAGLTPADVKQAIREARVPDVPEIREQFQLSSKRLLHSLTQGD